MRMKLMNLDGMLTLNTLMVSPILSDHIPHEMQLSVLHGEVKN